eukprot:scaffold4940_cov46-Attheya_sp.AAC.4
MVPVPAASISVLRLQFAPQLPPPPPVTPHGRAQFQHPHAYSRNRMVRLAPRNDWALVIYKE